MITYIFTSLLLTASLSTSGNSINSLKQSERLLSLRYQSKLVKDSVIYQTDQLIIKKISQHVYEHTSFLSTQDFGKVPCNGMVVVDQNEAIVFDTPADKASTVELIGFLTSKMAVMIKGVVATHFHADCVAGLEEFHQQGIPTYAGNRTIKYIIASDGKITSPKHGFDDFLELKAGNEKVVAAYYGEGHTKDNVIGYFAKERVLFGGCLIKEMGSGKGNLEDANVKAWSATVQKVKQAYPQAKIVIPGHGKTAGPELLDYTIKLFK